MKVGLIVECGRQGLEDIVCRRLCELIANENDVEIELDVVPMDNKVQLLEGCGAAARLLLDSGCERVVVLWDEKPAWTKRGDPLCWHHDRAQALGQFDEANVDLDRIGLVCIEREFESWLLHDHAMIARVLSKPTYRARVPKQRHPHRNSNPKATMTTIFRKYGGMEYVDVQFARAFAQNITTLTPFKKCATFNRFIEQIVNN